MDPEGQTGNTAADQAFLTAFEAGTIANQDFHHRDHLRLAWIQIHRLGRHRAADAVAEAIRQFAAHHGHADRYNDTMTRFWLLIVSFGIRRHPKLTFDALLAAEPHMLDKTLPFKHWSRERLTGEDAKRRWVDPDLLELPAASSSRSPARSGTRPGRRCGTPAAPRPIQRRR